MFFVFSVRGWSCCSCSYSKRFLHDALLVVTRAIIPCFCYSCAEEPHFNNNLFNFGFQEQLYWTRGRKHVNWSSISDANSPIVGKLSNAHVPLKWRTVGWMDECVGDPEGDDDDVDGTHAITIHSRVMKFGKAYLLGRERERESLKNRIWTGPHHIYPPNYDKFNCLSVP